MIRFCLIAFLIRASGSFLARGEETDWSSEKPKRTIFTVEQLERLEREFTRQQYMVGGQRFYLSKELGLTETQVKVWFQNRRIKWRKQLIEQQRSKVRHQKEPSTSGQEENSCPGSLSFRRKKLLKTNFKIN